MAGKSHQWNHDFPKLARDSGFIFNTHKPKISINWNDIKVVDIDKVIQERDFITVDEHINEILDCRLEAEFDLRILDSGFVKLFRLSQLAVEYLLQCRRHLDIAIPALRDEIREMADDTDHLKRQLRTKEEEIRKLRNKTRKQQKSFGNFKQSDLTNLLKRISWNEGGNMTPPAPPSIGEHTFAAFQKCQHCDKAFLNHFYLHSHISRRHPNLVEDDFEPNKGGTAPNSSPEHTGQYKIETEKLYLEIKELKERLNATEKRLQSKDLDKKIGELDNGVPDKGEVIINVPQSVNNDVDKNEGFEKVETDQMEKENITVEMFEDWKKEEREKFTAQMDLLKKQISENLNFMNSQTHVVEVKPTEEKEDIRILQVTAALEKQDEEVKHLEEKLQEKFNQDLTQITTRLESQETFWKTKLLDSQQEHQIAIYQLKQNTMDHLKEAEEVQRQYRVRIVQLEESVRNQQTALQEQAKLLVSAAENKSLNSHVKSSPSTPQKSIVSTSQSASDLRQKQNLHIAESQESLPPYDYELLKPSASTCSTSKDSQDSSKSMMTLFKRTNSKPDFNDTDTDSIDNGIEINPKPPPATANSKNTIFSSGNTTASSDTSVKPKKTKPARRDKKPSGLVTNATKGKARIATEKSHSAPDSSYKIEIVRNTKAPIIDCSKNALAEDDSTSSESSEESSEPVKVDVISTNKAMERLSREKHVMKAVRSDLRLIVEKRLQQLGVRRSTRGLPKDIFRKNMAAVQHRRHLVAKQHDGYNRLRKKIILAVDDKIKQNEKTQKPASIADRDLSKSNVSLSKVGSMFSNVKNKAINIMKSRENLRNLSERVKQDKNNDTKPPAAEETYYEKFKRITKTPSSSRFNIRENGGGDGNKSVLSILAPMRNQSAPNVTTRKADAINKAQDLERAKSSSESDVSSETETSSQEEEVNNVKHIVTTALSHVSSKSMENILKSPVRKPSSMEDGSIASSTPTKKVQPAAVSFGNLSDVSDISDPKVLSVESKQVKSKSDENLRMYAGATDSSDSEDDDKIDIRKAVSVENISNHSAATQKGVLKGVLSTGSLSKKKVIFDLDANEMKSLSASPSVSGAIEVKTKAIWESRADANTDTDSEWDISNVDEEASNHKATIHTEPTEVINLRTKQSPMIAELSKTIGAQLTGRTEKPPVGGIDTIFQAKSAQNSVKIIASGNNVGGSTTSIASSIFGEKDPADVASTSAAPVPKPRAAMPVRKGKIESDLELSDWSIEDLLK